MAYTQLALLSLILVTQAQEPYRMTRIDANPGLYFERLHNIRFRRADWRVIIAIDINKLEHEFPEEHTNLNLIYERCLKFPIKLECSSVLRTHYLNERIQEALKIHAEINELASGFSLAKTENDDPPKTIIRRSAPFGFIGTVSRTLFGTLDADDAEYYDSQIDKLYTDQKEIIQLVKNQSHIVRSDLHSVHKIIAELTTNVKTHRAKINELVTILNEDILLNYTIALNQYASSIEHSLDHYITSAQNLINIILLAQEGKVHPSLLSRRKLKAIITEIHNSIAHYEVPIPRNYERIEEIVRISQVSLEHRSRKIVIVIRIPLVNRIEYHLYKLHSLPILQNLSDGSSIWASISPQYPYLGLSNDHSAYFRTTESFLNSCKEIWYTHLCSLEVPLHEASVSESCEISLLLRPRKENLQFCNIKLALTREPYWHRLTRTGGWLYSIMEPESLQLLCGNQKNTLITIRGTGIMEIEPDCIAKTRTTTLIGTQTFSNTEQFYYNPNLLLNISEISPDIKQYHLTKPINRHQARFTEPNTESTVRSLHEIEVELGRLETHHRDRRFHFGLTYGTIIIQAIVILGIVSFYLWKTTNMFVWLRRLCGKRKPPISTTDGATEVTLEEPVSATAHPTSSQRIIIT